MRSSCKEPTHCKRPWCWERLKAGAGGVATEDETVGWHHPLNGMSLSKLWEIVEDRILACCSQWGHKEWDTTEWLNNNNALLCVY